MKRWLFILVFFGIFLFMAFAMISTRMTFPLITPNKDSLVTKYYDYSGITHAHTALSTGSGSIAELSRAAYNARCNFLIVTDLNPAKKFEDSDGYRDNVAVISAGEYSFLGGHVLGYGFTTNQISKGAGQAQIYFNELLSQRSAIKNNAFLVAAHPYLLQYNWKDLDRPGLQGLEIINLDSLWNVAFTTNKLGLLWSIVTMPFNPSLSYLRLFGEPIKELAAWDGILKHRMFVGFSGSDATANAIPIPGRSFHIPSYEGAFELTKNHLLLESELTGNFEEDRRKILSALNLGHFYFSLDLIGDPNGFYFIAKHGHQEWLMGQTIRASQVNGGIKLVADLGREIELEHVITLLQNGQPVARSEGRRLEYEVRHPGAYRVVVEVKPELPPPDGKRGITWIYSNAIRYE